MPIKKFGIVFCLNRPAGLYYMRTPKAHKAEDKKEKSTEETETTGPYIQRIS